MTRIHLSLACALATSALAFSCSSSDDNGSGGSNLGNAATGNAGTGVGANGGFGANATNSGGASGSGTGSTTGSGGTGLTTGSGGTGLTSGSGGSSGSTSGTGGGTNVPACAGLPVVSTSDAGSCAGIEYEAEHIDVDMYIMMDRSVSMSETVGTTGRIRWDFVVDAVQQFVTNPAVANIGVGIHFYPQSDYGDETLDCDVNYYATPTVPIGLASVTGGDVLAAVEAQWPLGLTPLVPALQGAIQYGQSYATSHPGRATVVVLVTDGFPTECAQRQVSNIVDAAEAGLAGMPRIRTYVVGLEAGFNLNQIAQAGGTDTAFLIDEADITGSFVNTLLNIADNPLACEYEMPIPTDGSMQLDYNKVQVVYTPFTGEPQEIPRAMSLGECAGSLNGGWYYDNNAAPTRILVCPCTCSSFAAGNVKVALGCEPRPVDIH